MVIINIITGFNTVKWAKHDRKHEQQTMEYFRQLIRIDTVNSQIVSLCCYSPTFFSLPACVF